MIMKKLPRKMFVASSLALAVANAYSAEMAGSQGSTPVLEEIVVTAMKRTQSIQDVAATISLVSSDELDSARITSSRDLGVVVSGLSMTEQGGFAQPKIRGIGTSIVGAGADSNIAFYIDGVYLPSQSAALFDLNDISSIEVLKGPQGALYGRNATGGAIVITTNEPSFEAQGKLGATYARFNEQRYNAYLTGPLTEKLAASIAVVNRTNDGYTDNVTLKEDSSEVDLSSVRGKLLYNATDDLKITLSGHYTDQEDNSALSYAPLNKGVNALWFSNAAKVSNEDPSKIGLNFRPYSDVQGWGGNIRIDYSTDWGDITSISSYSDLKQPFGTDVDATELTVLTVVSDFDQETFIQELYLVGDNDDALSWIAGLTYYSDESSTLGTVTQQGSARPKLVGDAETTAAAIYGELSYQLTDKATLTVGGRYSDEEKKAFGTAGIGNPGIVDGKTSWNAFTPSISLAYDLTDESSIYASYSEGFKSGLYNLVGLDPTPIEPEEIEALEVGYKLSTDALRFSASVFYYDYQDIQVNAIDQNVGGGGLSRVLNAASAEVYGLDLDLTAQLSEALMVKAGLTYNNAEYDKFPDAQVYIPIPNVGALSTIADVSGNKLERVPEYTAFATINYTQPAFSGDLDMSLTASYNDGYFWDAANSPRTKQDSFTIVNGDISWMPASQRYKLSVFGTNLTDDDYYQFVRTSAFGDSASYNKPRSIGAGIEVYF